ncbi:MAG: hypothetical protein IJC98_05465 [Clostridia bacterium]|nr:hypothetical protein [Clostridia bacterium]
MQETDGKVIIAAALDDSGLTEGIARMKELLQSLRSYAATQYRGMRSDASTSGNALIQQMSLTASRMVSSLGNGLIGGTVSVRGAASSMMSGILSELSLGTKGFSEIGAGIITSMVRGIRDSAEVLWQTVQALSSDMIAKLKDTFGIQSPSKVMRDEIGMQLGYGLAEGIFAARRAVGTAMDALSESVLIWDPAISMRAGSLGLQQHASSHTLQATQMLPPLRQSLSVSDTGSARSVGGGVVGNTFVFNQPIQTPYGHARAIKNTMEAMLYGV